MGTCHGRSCHTYPNDKLLQLVSVGGETREESCHTYPNDKLLQQRHARPPMVGENVVIPIQTISFYNLHKPRVVEALEVVIPIQTISFYNTENIGKEKFTKSCHTYPNDKLLQLASQRTYYYNNVLSYLSKR